jgi:hypothetical protein
VAKSFLHAAGFMPPQMAACSYSSVVYWRLVPFHRHLDTTGSSIQERAFASFQDPGRIGDALPHYGLADAAPAPFKAKTSA